MEIRRKPRVLRSHRQALETNTSALQFDVQKQSEEVGYVCLLKQDVHIQKEHQVYTSCRSLGLYF